MPLRYLLPVFALLQGPPAATPAAALRFDLTPRETIEARLARFSASNAERETVLKQMFEESGCRDENLREQPVAHERLPNLICRLPGATDSLIVVGAHFDHVSKGQGVVDNWSGASLLPLLFASLRAQPREHTYLFIGFTDEEGGLRGSKYYAGHLAPAERTRTRAMVNLDSLGLGPTNVWLNHSDRRLAEALGSVAAGMRLSLGMVNFDKAADDDSEPFIALHVPTLMIHSVTPTTLPILHSTRDSLDVIRMDDYYDSYRLVVACLAYLDPFLE